MPGMSHPKHIKGLVVAYSAKDIANQADGTTITNWPDRRSLWVPSQPMTQAGVLAYPVKTTDAGRPAAAFSNAVIRSLWSPNFSTPVVKPYTIAWVWRQAEASSQVNLLGNDGVNSIIPYHIITTGQHALYAGGGAAVAPTVGNFARRELVIWTVSATATTCYLNGNKVYSGTSTGIIGQLARLWIGEASGTYAGEFYLHEIMIYRRALRLSEVERLENYFQNEWGV